MTGHGGPHHFRCHSEPICFVIPSESEGSGWAAGLSHSESVRDYWVYIMASRNRVLCVGVTNDLRRRVYEHKAHEVPGFSARYRVDRLVHFEQTIEAGAAIAREKQLKGWRREKKVALIARSNPEWEDLAAGWVD